MRWTIRLASGSLVITAMRVGATTKETLMQMRAARMHGYNEPLQIDDVQVPEVGPTQVLIKVAATGMCRSDFQLVDGYFRQGLPVDLPSHRDTRSPAPLPLWAR